MKKFFEKNLWEGEDKLKVERALKNLKDEWRVLIGIEEDLKNENISTEKRGQLEEEEKKVKKRIEELEREHIKRAGY